MDNAEFSGAVFGGQYEIHDLLDNNGIIESYRAFQRSLNRPVAVHVLDPSSRDTTQWPLALVRGAEIAAQYAHPNILPVYDHGVHEGLDYVVVRLTEGGSLLQKLEQGALEILEVVNVVRQIASALDYVHAEGGCHGDLATVNIAFDHWGSPFIADFYLLGFLQVTDPARVIGVPAFMAPERMLGQAPDALTDQFALAGISYTMLTGQIPPRGRGVTLRPQDHRPEIPGAVNEVISRGLSFDPQGRFPTVVEFARQFEDALKVAPQHVFISYSRRDNDYVRQLHDYLQQNGLQIWIDDQIEHGDQWFITINDAIKTSAAVLVIMSPDAEVSEWVNKEILLAKRYRKPIFPILLHGEEMPILIDLQFADVRDGSMPDADFHRRVTRSVYGV
jgi:serine/threonine protein kinase